MHYGAGHVAMCLLNPARPSEKPQEMHLRTMHVREERG